VRLSDDTAGAAVSGPVLLVDWDVELVGEGIHMVCYVRRGKFTCEVNYRSLRLVASFIPFTVLSGRTSLQLQLPVTLIYMRPARYAALGDDYTTHQGLL